jgi:hypothetical protein
VARRSRGALMRLPRHPRSSIGLLGPVCGVPPNRLPSAVPAPWCPPPPASTPPSSHRPPSLPPSLPPSAPAGRPCCGPGIVRAKRAARRPPVPAACCIMHAPPASLQQQSLALPALACGPPAQAQAAAACTNRQARPDTAAWRCCCTARQLWLMPQRGCGLWPLAAPAMGRFSRPEVDFDQI